MQKENNHQDQDNKKIKNPLPVIFFTVFLDMLGYGILIPVIPLLLANPSSQFYLLPAGMSVAQGYIILGLMLAMFPLFQFLAAPILGQLSDKYGRKKVLLFSIIGTCLSYVLFAYGIMIKNIPLLFFSRALDGITGGNIAAAQAAIADVTLPKDRAKRFGIIGAAFGLGFIIGPYIGGKLSDPSILPWFHAATPFWFAAILSFLNVCFIYFFLDETLKIKKHDKVIKLGQSVKNIARAYTYKELRLLFLTVFLYTAGFSFFITFFNVYLVDTFKFTQGNIGDFFAYLGIWIVITQGFLIKYLSHYFKNYMIVRIGLFGLGFTILCYFLPNIWWELLLVAPFFAFFNGITMANLTGLISSSVDSHIQGEILGINSSIQALAQIFPPILAGLIAAKLTPHAPIYISATILLITATLFWIYYKPCLVHEGDICKE